jgi:cell wall-associated NlpC family hydrolase
MITAIGRMQEIQTVLLEFSAAPAAAARPKAATAALPTSAPAFAEALNSMMGSLPAALQGPAGAVMGAGPAGAPMNGTKLTEATSKYVGLPYVWGGNDPSVGLDCSSFVQNVYRDMGVELPRVTWDQMKQGTPVASMAQAQPGDLLFSFNGGHVAIYLGDGKAIDAPQPGKTIQVRDAWENDGNLTAIRRIVPAGSLTGPAAEIAGAASDPTAVAGRLAAAQASRETGAFG